MGNELSRTVAVQRERFVNWIIHKRFGTEPQTLHRDRSLRSGLRAKEAPVPVVEADGTSDASHRSRHNSEVVHRRDSKTSNASVDAMISSVTSNNVSRRSVLKRNSSQTSEQSERSTKLPARPNRMSSSRVTFVEIPPPEDDASTSEPKTNHEQDAQENGLEIKSALKKDLRKSSGPAASGMHYLSVEQQEQAERNRRARSPRPSMQRPRLSMQRSLSTGELRRVKDAQNRQSTSKIRRRCSSQSRKLTAAQIHMIKTIWKQQLTSQGPTVLGSKVFNKIFFKLPHMKDSFRKIAVLPAQYTNHDAFIKAHYKALADMVSLAINNLDNLSDISGKLDDIGRKHGFLTELGFKHNVWDCLGEAFIDSTLEWGDKRNRSDDFRKAWAVVIAFIIEKLKYGHQEEHLRVLYDAS